MLTGRYSDYERYSSAYFQPIPSLLFPLKRAITAACLLSTPQHNSPIWRSGGRVSSCIRLFAEPVIAAVPSATSLDPLFLPEGTCPRALNFVGVAASPRATVPPPDGDSCPGTTCEPGWVLAGISAWAAALAGRYSGCWPVRLGIEPGHPRGDDPRRASFGPYPPRPRMRPRCYQRPWSRISTLHHQACLLSTPQHDSPNHCPEGDAFFVRRVWTCTYAQARNQA